MDQRIIDLYDNFTHGRIDRRGFMERLDEWCSSGRIRYPEIASRSRHVYDQLNASARFVFIPFDEAFARILAFVETLDIPPE